MLGSSSDAEAGKTAAVVEVTTTEVTGVPAIQ